KLFGVLSDEEIEKVILHGNRETIKKGKLFLKSGQMADKLAFIESGILRSFYYTAKEQQVSHTFAFPNDFITSYSSYLTGKKAQESIEAIVDTKIISYNKDYVSNLIENSANWRKVWTMITEAGIVKMEARLYQMQMSDAVTRYQNLVNDYPEFIQSIPLKHIASYLGITQRHLSRIRGQIFQN
ncbi:MAG: Crp/Fnr family transcriptional regulator, partial [Bacteroidales bacterium]|nr:Crp/Fnr family transcriptional regulator [Bacteroidales bacterium]